MLGKRELLVHCLDNEFANSIVCITETWLTADCANSLLCDSSKFSIFRLDRDPSISRKKRGGGLLILVPTLFNAKLSCEPFCTDGFESISVDLFLKSHARRQTARICLVYRSPSHFDCQKAQSFCQHIDSIIEPRQPTFLIGDFNMPCIEWPSSTVPGRGPDSLEYRFLQLTLEKGLAQLVMEPTRGVNFLDLVFASEPNLVSTIYVEAPFGGSDHNVVKFSSDVFTSSAKRPTNQKGYNFHKANYTGLAQALDHVDWPTVFQTCSTAQQMWDAFLGVLHPLIARFVPKRKNRKTASSWPPSIQRLILKQKRLHKLHHHSPSEATRASWKSAAKEARSAARQELANREQEVLKNGTDNYFWHYVNSKLTCKSGLPCIQRDDGDLAESDAEKVEVFSEYFASVFQPDQTTNLNLVKETVKPTCNVTFPAETVYAHLRLLPNKVSAGVDGLPSIFFKNLAFQLAQPLASLFEVSFQTGILPSDWLVSLVTPIHKKNSKAIPSNYRPVSLTCVACRVMEMIVKEVVTAHMTVNRLISKSQHGFLRKHSTLTQLLETLNDWTIAVDEKALIDVAFADVSKAFDKLPHSKILESLEAYRIEGLLLNWLKAFLSNRMQSVVYNSCQSQRVAVTSGVPQGSVLGPLCFLAVINRLPNVIKSATIKLSADDCKLYFRINSNVDRDLFIADLCNLFEWAESNGLTLALNKTAIMHLGYGNPRCGYAVHGADLATTETSKDLGVLFSSNLKFAEHVASISKRAFSRVNLIFLAFYSRKPSFLVHMFKTFVRPVLEYASPIWSPYLKKDIDLLERVQKYFTRRIPGLTGDYFERLQTLKLKGAELEVLELRRLELDLIITYKIIHSLVDLSFSNFFEWSMAKSLRGHSFKLRLPRARLECRRHFFAVRVVAPWNGLSEETVTAHSLSIFKIRLQMLERPKLLKFLRGSALTAFQGRS